jgi:hypothetical protein
VRAAVANTDSIVDALLVNPLRDVARMSDELALTPGGFNAVGTLDRMLANPIPVLLELRDTLGFSDEQVQRVQAISEELQRTLDRRRETLGRRFDGVPAAEQGRIFADMQPDIERARREVMQAIQRVERLLTQDQWQRVPQAVRNPYQPAGGGAVRRPDGAME